MHIAFESLNVSIACVPKHFSDRIFMHVLCKHAHLSHVNHMGVKRRVLSFHTVYILFSSSSLDTAITSGVDRPIRVKFSSERYANEVLRCSWKLKHSADHNKIYIRKDLNEEEQAHLVDLKREAAERNNKRTEEQANQFFWKVKEWQLVKCCSRNN